MSLNDWTIAGDATLDASIKYAGNSSARMAMNFSNSSTLTHNTFSASQVQVILWSRHDHGSYADTYILFPSYGSLQYLTAINTWQKWRISFWYDSVSDIKWGRRELWTGGEWVEYGTDTNFGAGAPAACALTLKLSGGVATMHYAWFDELEVYS